MEREVKLLDCTVRDGGYVSGWDRSSEEVSALYRSCSEAGVNVLEVGYAHAVGQSLQRWAPVTEAALEGMGDLTGWSELAVMTDWGKCGLEDLRWLRSGPIKMVRLAAKPEDCLRAATLCRDLTDLGLKVSLNLMRISTISQTDLRRICRDLAAAGPNLLYLADSYGSCMPGEVAASVAIAVGECAPRGVQVGFHAHDNLSLAFANSLLAVAAGAAWVDCTVSGAGRGGGNLATELAVGYWRGCRSVRPITKSRPSYPRSLMTGLLNIHPSADLPRDLEGGVPSA